MPNVIAHYGSDEAGAREAVAGIAPERRLLLQADLAAAGEARRLWREALAWQGRIDVLVNNAADADRDVARRLRRRVGRQAGRARWEVNVRASADLVREAVRHFRARGGGVADRPLELGRAAWRGQSRSARVLRRRRARSRRSCHTIARNHAKEGVLAYLIAPGVVRHADVGRRRPWAQGGVEKVVGVSRDGRVGAAGRDRRARGVPRRAVVSVT